MNNILEEYLRMTENEPDITEKIRNNLDKDFSDEFNEQVINKVREIKNHPDDIANSWKKKSEAYPEIDEGEITIVDTPITPVIRRAYCPDCGEEIVTNGFQHINAITGKRQVLYSCPSCNRKMSIGNEFPRIEYLTPAKEPVSLNNIANIISPW